jgi:hypothetical protein
VLSKRGHFRRKELTMKVFFQVLASVSGVSFFFLLGCSGPAADPLEARVAPVAAVAPLATAQLAPGAAPQADTCTCTLIGPGGDAHTATAGQFFDQACSAAEAGWLSGAPGDGAAQCCFNNFCTNPAVAAGTCGVTTQFGGSCQCGAPWCR